MERGPGTAPGQTEAGRDAGRLQPRPPPRTGRVAEPNRHTSRRPKSLPRAAAGNVWLERGRGWLQSERAALAGLVLAGALLELGLVRGWLGALSLPGHPGFPAVNQDPLIWLLGDGPAGINRFLTLLALAFVPYLAALACCGRLQGRAALVVALSGSFLLGVTMLLSFPAGALDIFHNIMDGRLLWVYHLNPMLTPPSAVSGDPLYGYLHYWWSWRSSYGPLWFLLTVPATIAGGTGLESNILAFKGLPFAFELISVGLIALIARRIAPARVAASVVYFGWNPLVLWETAGNGHNDIVMMAFALLAVLLLLTRRWPLAFPALACSVLVKYVSLVLLPVFVLWILWRHGRRAIAPLAVGLCALTLVAVVAYAPFWSGGQTFEPLRSQAGRVIFSPASALLGAIDDVPNTAPVIHVRLALTGVFALLYGLSLLRLRRSALSLVRACAEAMFLVLVLMTWWFWPWYVVWGLVFAALLPVSRRTPVSGGFLLFSMTAMLVYVSSVWRFTVWNMTTEYAMALGTALLVFLPPVLYILVQVRSRGAPSPFAADAEPQVSRRRCHTAVDPPPVGLPGSSHDGDSV